MIECTKPKCLHDKDSCKDYWAPRKSWFDAWCDYNWQYTEGLYHYECRSCEFIHEPEHCKSSVSCLNACFGIRNSLEYETRLIRPQPNDYNLPSDYTFVSTTWGSFFYKYHGWLKTTRAEAYQLCQNDNAVLPVPLSWNENKFLLTLGMRYRWVGVQIRQYLWLGITGMKKTNWTTDNGSDVKWFNWRKNAPDNNAETGVVLGYDGQWDDRDKNQKHYVLCWYIYERYQEN